MEKSGQAAVDQRRILDAVRQRLDMSAENDQKIAEHFNNFATAISTSTETTRMAGEILRLLEENNRKRGTKPSSGSSTFTNEDTR